MTSMDDVRLIVVDAHGVRRAALVGFLSEWAERQGGRVVGADVVEPFEAAACRDAPMVLLSVGASFAEPRWESTIRLLHGLDADRPVAVLADGEAPRDVLTAFRAGARGFLPTSLAPEVAFAALSFIMQGGAYVPPSVLAACGSPQEPPTDGRRPCPPGTPAIAPPAREPDASSEGPAQRGEAVCARHGLTERQRTVLAGLCRGESNKQIARDHDMAEATVKVHVRQVLRKLGASNRTQAALIASGSSDAPPRSRGRPEPPVLVRMPTRAAAMQMDLHPARNAGP